LGFDAKIKKTQYLKVAMDTQRYKERILETENLTDELEDSDANFLLDWGFEKLDRVLEGNEDAETGGERVNALMAVMRKINRILGAYSEKDSAELQEDLSALQGLFEHAFSPSLAQDDPEALESRTSPANQEPAAAQLAQMTTREALEYLTQQFHPLE
jgi:hypothetical protein